MMADSMRGQLESGQLSEKQKEQAKALLDRMEKLLVNDFISGIQETKSMCSARPILLTRQSVQQPF